MASVAEENLQESDIYPNAFWTVVLDFEVRCGGMITRSVALFQT